MDYDGFLNWLNSYSKFGIKLDLERIKFLCKRLNNPQDNYKTIHIGGTNGKGSISKYLASILIDSRKKVGIYTSPHIERFSERIIVNNNEISESDLIKIYNQINPIISEMEEQGLTPTYFEIVTAIAFLHFSIKKVDIAIIEVGLGGRYDATNIIKPILTIISNVSLDHCDRLGDTIEKISYEKAGIIKNNIPIITSAKNKALEIIKKISKEKNSSLTTISEKNYERINFNYEKQIFQVNILDKKYIIKTKILGKYQGENISCAVAASVFLNDHNIKISKENIINGIFKTKNPGRMEIVSKRPLIVLDGAHNLKGIKKLKKTLKNDFEFNRLILIIGILEDKKYIDMLKEIIPLADKIITTKSKNKRSLNPYSMKKEIEYIDNKKAVTPIDNIEQAVLIAKKEGGLKDIIVICGSLFVVGEARVFLKEISNF